MNLYGAFEWLVMALLLTMSLRVVWGMPSWVSSGSASRNSRHSTQWRERRR